MLWYIIFILYRIEYGFMFTITFELINHEGNHYEDDSVTGQCLFNVPDVTLFP